jgi:hypothetical protein
MNQTFRYEMAIFIPCFGKDGNGLQIHQYASNVVNNVKTIVCLNGSKPFKIDTQGCPLTPYLFILARKVLNFMVKEVMRLGDVI